MNLLFGLAVTDIQVLIGIEFVFPWILLDN
jgi:hypothetical protein